MQGSSPDQIFRAVDERWGIEYPATNNAVVNGGFVATSVWFGGGDFHETLQLAVHAADFADTDCNAANSESVVAAMHGMKALPPEPVAELNDRIFGKEMGPLQLTPPVDESITQLAQRTAKLGTRNRDRSWGHRRWNDAPNSGPGTRDSTRRIIHARRPDAVLESRLDARTRRIRRRWRWLPGIRGITYLDGDIARHLSSRRGARNSFEANNKIGQDLGFKFQGRSGSRTRLATCRYM